MVLFLSLAAVTAIFLWARQRLQALEERAAAQERRIASLTERIFVLEGHRNASQPPPPLPIPQPVSPPPVLTPPPTAAAPPPVAAPEVGPQPQPPERDMETLIGSNWLSKLGVLLLLIGIALFIGFSLTELGPVGRILTGLTACFALLGAGVAAERMESYRTLGVALIGGGWAGLYFTAFAVHGIPEARVIESPAAGFFLLLGVAAGMILHSLRYRNQTVTGLAYMAAFLTIAISSLTQFSAAASVPLLASLLFVSWRFGWQGLAAAGALFSYAAYGFDLATGDKDRYFIQIGEPVIWTYWVILETFDLAAKRRGATFPIAPLNLVGFLFAMAAVWPRGSGWEPDWMLGAMALAQLASAFLRGRWNGSRQLEDDSVFGGFRASITYSSLFTAALLIDRFSGEPRFLALSLLAEAIAVFGWLAGSAYLRHLGAALFLLPLAFGDQQFHRPAVWTLFGLFLVNRLFLQGGIWYSVGIPLTLVPLLADFTPHSVRPVLLTIAAGGVGLLLRWREKPEFRWVGFTLSVFSVAFLLTKTPDSLLWVTIGLPAALYAAFGWAAPEGLPRLATFSFFQVYACCLLYRLTGESPWLVAAWLALALASWIAGALRPLPSLAGSALLPEFLAIAYWALRVLGRQENLAAQSFATAALFAMYLVRPRGGDAIARATSAMHGVLAVIAATAVIEDFVSGRSLTLAWSAEAFGLLGAGIGLQRRQLRISGLVLFALCLGKLFFFDFSQLDTISRMLSFVVVGCLLIAASWIYSRFREQIHRFL